MGEVKARYLRHLHAHGAYEGVLDDGETWLALWSADELDLLTHEFGFDASAPGYFPFAGDGGNEVFAVAPDGSVVRLPLVGMHLRHARRVADSLDAFLVRIPGGG